MTGHPNWVRNGLIFLMLNKVEKGSWSSFIASRCHAAVEGARENVSVLIVDVVMNGLVGWENVELSFSKVKLKLVVLRPHRRVQETE